MPYVPHKLVTTPSDDKPMWRYMSFVKFTWMLENRALYFARADTLGDPFEGAIPTNATLRVTEIGPNAAGELVPQKSYVKQAADLAQKELMQYRTLRRNQQLVTYVSCWYADEDDSDALWKVYASPTDGVAIRTTIGGLKNSLKTDDGVVIGAVDYNFDKKPPVSLLENAYVAFLSKRAAFKHEQEVRAIIKADVAFNMALPAPDPIPHPRGLEIEVALDTLIATVVVAPQAQPWFYKLVTRLITRYGPAVSVEYSPIAGDPWTGHMRTPPSRLWYLFSGSWPGLRPWNNPRRHPRCALEQLDQDVERLQPVLPSRL